MTDAKILKMLKETFVAYQLTGSQYICGSGNDIDFVCLAKPGTEVPEPFLDDESSSGSWYDDIPLFESYRYGDVNLIMTESEDYYHRFCIATELAAECNLEHKPDRISLFQYILYHASERVCSALKNMVTNLNTGN